MKRHLLLPLMLLALALTACASKPAVPTAADFEVQPGEYRYQDSDGFFVETEKGNYYMNPSGDGVIHFSEPGSHEFHVLCNKPNCGHASADCNAFLEVAFGYYNGHLYGVTLQDHFELIQMDMDGTNHRVITQLPEQKDLSGNFSGGGSYFFDNGYLIFLAFPSTSNPDYALPVYKIHTAVSGGYPASHRLASRRCVHQQRIYLFPHASGGSIGVCICRGQLRDRAH